MRVGSPGHPHDWSLKTHNLYNESVLFPQSTVKIERTTSLYSAPFTGLTVSLTCSR